MARGKECVRVEKSKKLNKCQGSNLRWSDHQKVILLKRESCESLPTFFGNAREVRRLSLGLTSKTCQDFSRFDRRARFRSSRGTDIVSELKCKLPVVVLRFMSHVDFMVTVVWKSV